MFALFRRRGSKAHTPASLVVTRRVTRHTDQSNPRSAPHWLQTGDYTFTRANAATMTPTTQEPDGFNKVTHGRPAEMLEDDNVAWNTPPETSSPVRKRKQIRVVSSLRPKRRFVIFSRRR